MLPNLLGRLNADVLIQTLADPEAGVRINALRIAESHDDAAVTEAATKLASDADPQVRLQLAFTLGAWGTADAARALGTLLVERQNEPHLVAAAMTSLHSHNIAGVTGAVQSASIRNLPKGFLTQAVALGQLDCVAALLEALLTIVKPDDTAATARLLAELLDSLEHGVRVRGDSRRDSLCERGP